MRTSKRNELLAKVSDRIAVHREQQGKTIAVVAYTQIDPRLYKIIAVYDGDTPTAGDLQKWAIRKGEGKFKIVEETLSHYDVRPYPLISFLTETNIIRRPFAMAMEDKNLVAVADNMYMDINLKTPWKTEEFQGNKFLVRIEEDSLADFFSSQLSIPGPRTSKTVNAVLAMTAKKGDKVKYIRPDTMSSRGQVTKVSSDGTLNIRDAETNSVYERSPGTVLEIIKEGPSSKTKDKELEAFWAEIYGPDMAKKLMS